MFQCIVMYSHTWWMYLDGQACQWNAHFHHLLSSIKEEIWGCERKEDERKNGYNRCGGEETRQKWGKGWCRGRERKNGEDENMQIVLKIEYILDAVSIANYLTRQHFQLILTSIWIDGRYPKDIFEKFWHVEKSDIARGPWFHIVLIMTILWVRDVPKCAYELLTLNALSFPLKCCNSAFFVSRDNLQIRDRKTPQIRWLAHLLRICSVFALSTEKRQSDSLGRARLYCDNSQVMALVRFYTAGNQGKTEQCRTRLVPTPVPEGKELVRYS